MVHASLDQEKPVRGSVNEEENRAVISRFHDTKQMIVD